MIEICNRGDFIKAQTYRSVFVCRSCGQADHPAERRGFEPLKPFRGLLAFQAGQFNHSCTFPRIKKKNQPSDRLILCGERGIRTILPILNISTCYSEIKIKVHRITHR